MLVLCRRIGRTLNLSNRIKDPSDYWPVAGRQSLLRIMVSLESFTEYHGLQSFINGFLSQTSYFSLRLPLRSSKSYNMISSKEVVKESSLNAKVHV
jgi:hypothetical protein